MAGPKAPIGSLKQHANLSARLAQSEGSSLSRPMKATSKKHKKAAPVDEDESDSSSSSDSDSEAASDGKHLLQLAMSTPSKRKVQQTSTKSSKMPPAATVKAITETPLSEKKTAEKKSAVPTVEKEPVAEESSDSSSSSDDSSDSDAESTSTKAKEDGGKLANTVEIVDAKKKKNSKNSGGTIAKVEPESSSSESSESEESEGGAEVQAKAKITKKDTKESTTTSPESSSESESSESESEEEKATESQASESEASEDSSSEDEESGSEPEEADESMAIGMRNDGMASARIPEIIGNDFHLRKAGDGVDALDVAQVFVRAKMEGKQLWYFTAPASIPIEVVEKLEIPLERAQQGLSILSHNGDDYGVAFEDASTSRSIKLLIPNKAGDTYGMMNRPVDQAMHLKRITQFSNDSERATTFTQSHSISGRPARPQPANLKARFQPIGVSNGSMGKIGVDTSSGSDEDVEMAYDRPLFSQKAAGKQKETKAAQTPKSEKKEKKRKHAAGDEPASSQTIGTGRSAKKARVESHTTPSTSKAAAKATPVPATNGSSKATTTPAKKKAASDSVASSSKPPASSARKESVVPLPANFRHMSQPTPDAEPRASPVKEEKVAVKKEPKSKKDKDKEKGKDKDVAKRAIKREKSATPSAAPTKVTPIAPPGLPPHLRN